MDIIQQIEEIQSPTLPRLNRLSWDLPREERLYTTSRGPSNPPIFQVDSSAFDTDRLSVGVVTSSRLEDYTIQLDRLRSAINDVNILSPIRDNVVEIMSYQQRIRSLEDTVRRLENTITSLQEQLITSRS